MQSGDGGCGGSGWDVDDLQHLDSGGDYSSGSNITRSSQYSGGLDPKTVVCLLAESLLEYAPIQTHLVEGLHQWLLKSTARKYMQALLVST